MTQREFPSTTRLAMPELPSEFWGGWIVTLTVASLAGLSWLVWSAYFSKSRHDDEASPVWDETLTEGSHPAPMWWFWMMLVSLVISVVYLMLYPGLGRYRGMLEWSQGGQLERRMVAFDAAFGPRRAAIAATPVEQLRSDAVVMQSARRVFLEHCAACHGADAGGQANAFPDLTDDDWQWGGSPDEIEQTIRGGRQAVMIGWQAVLGDDGVAEVVQHVRSLSGAAPATPAGATRYAQFCVACHGAAGEGNPLLGAPDLTDPVSLYGNSVDEVTHSVAEGRQGVMPAFGERLDDTRVRMLVAWLSGARSGGAPGGLSTAARTPSPETP
jgi:cytochrome c oxidase cbb3-type subunit 3